jgi:hypothetical protein
VEKIAVHCPTEEIFKKVLAKRNLKWEEYYSNNKTETCVCLNMDGMQSRAHLRDDGYTIIPASEYLKEGGNEVEFKVGDRVECVNNGNINGGFKAEYLKEGHVYTIIDLYGDKLKLDSIDGYVPYAKRFKLATKSIKQNKEEVMKDNNINSKVLEVFGDEVKGSELVIIDRHYDVAMLEKILMAQFSGEIKKACKDAEKALKKEEDAKE